MIVDKRLVLFFFACLVIYLIPVIVGGQVPETPDEAVYVNGAIHFFSLFSEPATYNLKYDTPAFKLVYQNYLADKGLLLGKYPPGMYFYLAVVGAFLFIRKK